MTDFSQNARVESGLVEELDGDVAGDDAYAIGIGLSKELAVDTLLFGRQV